MTKLPKLMAAGDVTEALGVSYQYIDKLAKEGKLRYEQTSSGRIFFADDVMAFKKERAKKAKKDPRIKIK